MPRTRVQVRDERSNMAVERAARVLHVICTSGQPSLSLSEISSACGLSPSTVHRLVIALSKHGLVIQDPETRRYAAGPRIAQYGLQYLSRLRWPDLALNHMRRLRDATRETITLSVLDGMSRVYIEQVPGLHEIRQIVTLGQPTPLHLGGSGKAILAFLPQEEQERYLAQPDLAPGVKGPVDIARLKEELVEIRRRGYATSTSERLPGAASVAAPIRNFRNEVLGCISICGLAWRFTPDLVDRFGRMVIAAAAAISRELGAPDGNPAGA